MPSALLTEVYSITADVLSRQTPEKLTIINLGQELDELMTIDGLARNVWNSINGKRTIAEIIELVQSEQKVPASHRERFQKDTLNFFDQIIKLNLIQRK